MQDQPGRDVTSLSSPQGSRTTPRGPTYSAAVEKIPFPLPLQTSSDFSKGTRGFTDGSHSVDVGSYPDLDAIDAADLSPTRTLAAQLLWTVRNFVISENISIDRPIHEWSIDDIIRAARGSQ